ncbi:unnamed protein product [Peronospora farinosa]|uniref:Uncharacterized protein n=1 Tax=Peronospora farinosa TaxID=134698 RepID=A0ABN8C940_9STRA|nr:unnamed protein product [Peronospora farinosa]
MHQKAGDELSKLTMKTSDKEVLSRLAAAKKVPAMKNAVDTVEKIVLLQNWIKNGHDEKVFNMLIADKVDVAALLADPLFQSWMELFKQIRVESPIPPLFKMLMGHFEERVLTQQLYAALNTEAAKETADILTSYQILYWHDHKNTYPDDRVFTLLGVKDEGVNMFESLKWNSWISFMKGQEGKSKFSKQALALPLLRKHFNDDFLVKLFDDAIKKKKKSAIYYKRSLNIMQKNDAVKKEREDHMRKESVEKEGPVTRKRLRNGGEAPAPTKRQRKDDGQ